MCLSLGPLSGVACKVKAGVCKRFEHRPRWGFWRVILGEGLGRLAGGVTSAPCGCVALRWCGSVEKALYGGRCVLRTIPAHSHFKLYSGFRTGILTGLHFFPPFL